MTTQQKGQHIKPPIDAAMSGTPNEVIVRAKSVRGASYEWQMSMDGGTSWVGVGTSTVSNITIPGLKLGATYLFRVRTTQGHTTSAWVTTTEGLTIH